MCARLGHATERSEIHCRSARAGAAFLADFHVLAGTNLTCKVSITNSFLSQPQEATGLLRMLLLLIRHGETEHNVAGLLWVLLQPFPLPSC